MLCGRALLLVMIRELISSMKMVIGWKGGLVSMGLFQQPVLMLIFLDHDLTQCTALWQFSSKPEINECILWLCSQMKSESQIDCYDHRNSLLSPPNAQIKKENVFPTGFSRFQIMCNHFLSSLTNSC